MHGATGFCVCAVWTVRGWIQEWGQVCEQERGGRRESESRECFFLRVCQSLAAVGRENTKARLFFKELLTEAGAWTCCWFVLLVVKHDGDLRGSKARRCWKDTVRVQRCFVHKLLNTLCCDGDCEWAVCLQFSGISLSVGETRSTSCSHRWVLLRNTHLFLSS